MISNACIQLVMGMDYFVFGAKHYSDVIMSAIASQITSVSIVYSTVCWGADQRKHQSSASLAFVRGIHRWPGNSPHKWPVTRKMFPFDDDIMVMPHLPGTEELATYIFIPKDFEWKQGFNHRMNREYKFSKYLGNLIYIYIYIYIIYYH